MLIPWTHSSKNSTSICVHLLWEKNLNSTPISRFEVRWVFLGGEVYLFSCLGFGFFCCWFIYIYIFLFLAWGFGLDFFWNKHTINEVYYNLQRISSKIRKYSLLKQYNYLAEVSTLTVHMNKSLCVLECGEIPRVMFSVPEETQI